MRTLGLPFKLFLSAVFLTVLSSTCFGLTKEPKPSVWVEPAIHERLQNEKEVSVIVELQSEELDFTDLQILKEEVSRNQSEVLSNLDTASYSVIFRYEVLNALALRINSSALVALMGNPEKVRAVYVERKLDLSLAESVPLINANDVWTLSTPAGNITGIDQTICVVDSGIDYNHADLGACFGAGCKVKGGIDFVNMDFDPIDDNGHGTHVAGIAAASGGIDGVAPGADLIASKVCDTTGSCNSTAMVAGVDYCLSNIYNLGTDVITMSIGDHGGYNANNPCPTWMDFAIDFAEHLGIPITIASGNDAHKNGISYPACSPKAISVGATYDADVGAPSYSVCSENSTAVDQVACFSNTSSDLDVFAPGSVITSTALGSGYRPDSGTSMATPHVAGLIALIKQQDSTLVPSEILRVLTANGTLVTDPANNVALPRIDALASLRDVRGLTFSPEYDLVGNGNGQQKLLVDSENNLHLLSVEAAVLTYSKFDNNGNSLVPPVSMTASTVMSFSATIDLADNISAVWSDDRNGTANTEIYFAKFDRNGTILTPDLRISNVAGASESPDIEVDSNLDAHIVWSDINGGSNYRIFYSKVDSRSSIVVSPRVIDNPTRYPGVSIYWSRFPSLKVDLNGNLHVFYQFNQHYYRTVSNAPPYNNVYTYYHVYLDNLGARINSDMSVFSFSFNSSGGYNLNVNWGMRPSLAIDDSNNVLMLRTKGTYIRTVSQGGYIQYYIEFDPSLQVVKIDPVGVVLETWDIAASNNDHSMTRKRSYLSIVWAEDDSRHGVFLKRLDLSGNELVGEQEVSTTSNVLTYSSPTLVTDGFDENHLIYSKGGSRKYVRTLESFNLSMPLPASIGQTIPIDVYDRANPGAYYILALSFGRAPGQILSGRILPLNPDALFIISLGANSAFASNFHGYLNSSGRERAFLTIPNDPGLIGSEIYTAFLTINSTGFATITPYFPIKIVP